MCLKPTAAIHAQGIHVLTALAIKVASEIIVYVAGSLLDLAPVVQWMFNGVRVLCSMDVPKYYLMSSFMNVQQQNITNLVLIFVMFYGRTLKKTRH